MNLLDYEQDKNEKDKNKENQYKNNITFIDILKIIIICIILKLIISYSYYENKEIIEKDEIKICCINGNCHTLYELDCNYSMNNNITYHNILNPEYKIGFIMNNKICYKSKLFNWIYREINYENNKSYGWIQEESNIIRDVNDCEWKNLREYLIEQYNKISIDSGYICLYENGEKEYISYNELINLYNYIINNKTKNEFFNINF